MVAGIYALLMIGMYYPTSMRMLTLWGRDDYNYCYLIPFVFAYLLWEKRQTLLESASLPSWGGLLPFVAGLLLYWLGELGGEYYTVFISWWLVLVGLCWLHFGWAKLKVITFPLIILLTLFPFPDFIRFNASIRLQLISSQLGTALMRLYGLSAYRDGNVIDLGFTQLQIVEACSGLRYVLPLLIIGLILVYFFKAPWWKRALLLASTIPWAIIVNAFRVALTGILASIWGMGVIEGFSHDFAGWLVFMVSLGVLLGEMWLLGKIGPQTVKHGTDCSAPPPSSPRENGAEGNPLSRPEASEHALAASSAKAQPTSVVAPAITGNNRSWLPKAILTSVLMLLTFGLSYGIEFREKTPSKRPLAEFPLQAGNWSGKPQVMENDVLRHLRLSDYVMINYRNPGGKMVDFYVAYYESQRKGASVHTPDTCLPGGGWVFEKAELISFPTPGQNGGTTTVNRAFMTKTNLRQLVYYWFPQRGRILHNLHELKLYAFWDALTQQRTDGALVRLITPLSELEPPEAADQRLQEFTRQVLPLLAEYLPGRHID